MSIKNSLALECFVNTCSIDLNVPNVAYEYSLDAGKTKIFQNARFPKVRY